MGGAEVQSTSKRALTRCEVPRLLLIIENHTVIAALIAVLLFWSLLLWIGLALASLLLLLCVWWVWGVVHRRRTQHRLNRAEAAKAEEEVAQQKAITLRLQAEAAQAAALVNAIPATYVGLMLPTPTDRERLATWAQPRKVIYNGMPETPPPMALPAPSLPQAHAWEVIEPEVGPDHFYLGTIADELGRSAALWVPLDGVITLVSIGPQGLGKTTLARNLALQQVIQGGEVAICDWYNDIAAEMGQFFPHCYSEPEDCERYVETVLAPDMEVRHAEYKAGRRDFPARLWCIDEWAMFKKACPAMAEALVLAFSVWRKLGLRTFVSSVALDTRDLGISKSAVSTLALFSGNENLARTWGLSGVKPQLDQLYKTGKGYCLITSQHLQRQADLLALPNVSSTLFQAVLHRKRPDLIERALATYQGLPALPQRGGTILSFPSLKTCSHEASEPAQEERKGKEEPVISSSEREAILAEWRRGTAPSYIHKALRRASNYYYVVQRVIAEAEAQEADA